MGHGIFNQNVLVFSGAVKGGSDNKLDRENTEVTLLKHASVINMCVSLDEELLGHIFEVITIV